MTKNPFNLIEIGFNSGGLAVRKYFAWQIIRFLPKLKSETDSDTKEADVITNDVNRSSHTPGLRRRIFTPS